MRVNEYQKNYIQNILKKEICNNELAIMAPTTDKGAVRIYANGGLLGEIKRTKANYLSNKGYVKYINKEFENLKSFKEQKIEFEKGFEDESDKADVFIKKCTTITNSWASAKRQTHEERKKETEIIIQSRNGNAVCFVDMEFNLGPWKMGGKTEYGKCNKDVNYKNRGGRVDLIVYDNDKGFGLIELKYDGKNPDNIGKHFADFDTVIHNTRKDEIIAELIERLDSLQMIGVLPKFEGSVKKDLWYGFLFVGSEKSVYKEQLKASENWKCEETINNRKVIINWEDLKEEYEKYRLDDARFIWIQDIKDIKDISLKYNNMESYKKFIQEN